MSKANDSTRKRIKGEVCSKAVDNEEIRAMHGFPLIKRNGQRFLLAVSSFLAGSDTRYSSLIKRLPYFVKKYY